MSERRRLGARGRIEYTGARVLSTLPRGVQLRLAGGRPLTEDGDTLDPGVQLILRLLELRGGGTLRGPSVTPAASRARLRREARTFAGRATSVAAVHELEVDGAAGRLRARHYVPPPGHEPRPLLLFLHGGGFVTGDLDTHDEPCRQLCRHADVHVVSVDYRLAPEHPFPAPVEDAYAALRWAQANAAALGADPQRIAIGGDSAGGNLATVATQFALRDRGPLPVLQVLIYPVTNFAEQSRSKRVFDEGLFLTRSDMDWFEGHYIGAADRADPALSPLQATDLAGMPPAIVATAAFDPLRDEGEAYGAALREAGTPVTLYRAPGLIHGFVNFTAVNRAAEQSTLLLCGMVRAALAMAGVPAAEPAA